jgi:hypothetical protein
VGQIADRREDNAGQHHHYAGEAHRWAMLKFGEAQQNSLLEVGDGVL